MNATMTQREARILRPLGHTEASLVPALVVERRRMLDERLRAAQADGTPKHTSTHQVPHYSGVELAEPAVRAGADDHMGLPSRRGDCLYYRDGRAVHLDANYRGAAAPWKVQA